MEKIEIKALGLTVSFDFDNLNIQIKDSYQITNKRDIETIIDIIMYNSNYKKIAAAGFTRARQSLIREWKAHNVLYYWGYKKEQTGTVDLNQHESRGRRLAYFFLSFFF